MNRIRLTEDFMNDGTFAQNEKNSRHCGIGAFPPSYRRYVILRRLQIGVKGLSFVGSMKIHVAFEGNLVHIQHCFEVDVQFLNFKFRSNIKCNFIN